MSSHTALRKAAQFWFLIAITGQVLFAVTVASFYGMTAVHGDWSKWSKFTKGLVHGDRIGNSAMVAHVTTAVLILGGGALQLVPSIRSRHPRFHRWMGRIYMVSAVVIAGAGLYMLWFRHGTGSDLSQRIGLSIDALLIWLCAAVALRYAIARDFAAHRRWALRLFLVTPATWFFRIGLFFSFVIFQRPFGFDPNTFTGPFLTFLAFAQYLLPLAILELYLCAQSAPRAFLRVATASVLIVITLAMGAGIFAGTNVIWVPELKTAFNIR